MSKIRNHKRTSPRIVKPNPMKGKDGILAKIRKTKNKAEAQSLLAEARGYEFISPLTARRIRRAANSIA